MPAELHLPDLPEVPVVLGPVAPRPPRPPQPLASRLRDAVSAYLPMLLMVLLALGTWWLVQNTPRDADPRETPPVRHEPDYLMDNFVAQRFAADGRLVLRLQGERLRHYPDTDEVEIDGVRIEALSPDGRRTTATARQAVLHEATQRLRLIGGADVLSEVAGGEPVRIRGEDLRLDARAQRLTSDQPVQVRQGGTTLSGGGLDYDQAAQRLQLLGAVRAVAPAQAVRGAR
jgi:lipopolysaccharide export system protein LptC